MQNLIDSIRDAVQSRNFYAALFVALAIPDICAALEHGKTSGKKYAAWWEKYMASYKGFVSGNDGYALRCSVLHQGTSDITEQRKREVLEHFVFMTKGAHCNLFQNCIFNGEEKSFLQLNAAMFCEDFCVAAEGWLSDMSSNKEVMERVRLGLEIHDPGHVHLGLIKFS